MEFNRKDWSLSDREHNCNLVNYLLSICVVCTRSKTSSNAQPSLHLNLVQGCSYPL